MQLEDIGLVSLPKRRQRSGIFILRYLQNLIYVWNIKYIQSLIYSQKDGGVGNNYCTFR